MESRAQVCNYCQFVPWFDHLLGTFEPYETDADATARRSTRRRQQARAAGSYCTQGAGNDDGLVAENMGLKDE